MNNSLNITTGSSAGRPLSAQYRCATFARMNSKSTVASIWRSRWSFGTSSSSVTISSSCCVGMGVFSEGRLFVRRPARRVRRAKSRTQKRWIRPTPTPTWLRDDDGDVLKPSPIDAVASMILPPASVLPFAR
ncbi:non-ribosomal peptide synthase [Burkholderia pseudomallei]|nr:non-ribosomal peptide synthase [Burkholderia pseudomallei]